MNSQTSQGYLVLAKEWKKQKTCVLWEKGPLMCKFRDVRGEKVRDVGGCEDAGDNAMRGCDRYLGYAI
jgi:hypothetical protein